MLPLHSCDSWSLGSCCCESCVQGPRSHNAATLFAQPHGTHFSLSLFCFAEGDGAARLPPSIPERPAAGCAVAFPFAGGARALGPVCWRGWRWVSSPPACSVGRPLPGLPASLSAASVASARPTGPAGPGVASSATPTSSSRRLSRGRGAMTRDEYRDKYGPSGRPLGSLASVCPRMPARSRKRFGPSMMENSVAATLPLACQRL